MIVTAASQYSDTVSGIENLCIIEKLRSEGKEKQSQGGPGAFPPSPGRPRGLGWGKIGLRPRGVTDVHFPTPPPPPFGPAVTRTPDGPTGVVRGGSCGTPTYMAQNDPHDALIILRYVS